MKNKPSKLSELKRTTAATRAAILRRTGLEPLPYRGRKYVVFRRAGGTVRRHLRSAAFVIREVSR